jgi:glycosyltransferase involved in cell wall biosynthesis
MLLLLRGGSIMRVVIAAVSSNTHMSGVSRHAANIVRCLLTRSEVSSVHLLVAPWEHEHVCEAVARKDSRLRIHSVQVRSGTLARNLWYYFSLPGIALQLEASIVHIAYPSPVRRDAFHCPTVVSLHDLYPYDIPANFGFPKVFFNRMVLQECLRSVSAIACVSESTRKHLGLTVPRATSDQSVTVTIYNCVEPAPCGAKPSFAEGWNGEPFLLCVAQHRRNKNILLVLQVFKRLLLTGVINSKTRLLIVGMPGPETSHIKTYIRGANLRGVTLVSGISDAEMHWCYKNCELLLAPSLVEGFGLPVAEALLAGCRVVCSDIPPFREVGGHYCRYVALGATAVEDFVRESHDALRERRPLAPLLSQLSSSVIAEQYLRLYLLMIATFKSKTSAPASRRSELSGQRFLGITRPTGPDR